jgi:murein DD-endopeptidase MepM/ murein hydrolase activator NlpD
MLKVNTQPGQTVVRGQVIGYVGSTGKSTGPHCHYEVRKKGVKVDPIYYFYNDLTPEEFDRILKAAANNKQSLD